MTFPFTIIGFVQNKPLPPSIQCYILQILFAHTHISQIQGLLVQLKKLWSKCKKKKNSVIKHKISTRTPLSPSSALQLLFFFFFSLFGIQINCQIMGTGINNIRFSHQLHIQLPCVSAPLCNKQIKWMVRSYNGRLKSARIWKLNKVVFGIQ